MSGTETTGDRVATVTCSCGSTDTVTASWAGYAWSIPVDLVGDHTGHTVRTELQGSVGVTNTLPPGSANHARGVERIPVWDSPDSWGAR